VITLARPHDHKNEKQECYTAPRKNIKIFKKRAGHGKEKRLEKKLRLPSVKVEGYGLQVRGWQEAP